MPVGYPKDNKTMTGCFQCDNGTLVCRCGRYTQQEDNIVRKVSTFFTEEGAENMKSRRQMEDELQVVSKDADRLREEVRTAQKALSRAENRRAELVMMLAPKMTGIVRVSDHALIRYLERKFNMDIESIRAEILTPDRIAAIKAGAKQIAANGIKFAIKDQTVTTVTD